MDIKSKGKLNHSKENKMIETTPEKDQTSNLSDKKFKATVLKIFRVIKKNMELGQKEISKMIYEQN